MLSDPAIPKSNKWIFVLVPRCPGAAATPMALRSRSFGVVATLLALGPTIASGEAAQCTPRPGVCLTAAKPILQIIKNTHDPAACCAACVNNTKCVSWNVNSGMDECFLRVVEGPTNPGKQCISGNVRPGPPGPSPPGPKPPPPPPGPPPPPSDQRPRFHFAPTKDATNDVQGPFYDPTHKMYHMGYAWHVNGTHGIGSAPSAKIMNFVLKTRNCISKSHKTSNFVSKRGIVYQK